MHLKRFLSAGLMIYLCSTLSMNAQDAEAPKIINELPTPNVLALTPENFCNGIPNVMAKTMQDITIEVNAICPGTVPSQEFLEILAEPYMGNGDVEDFIFQLPSNENIPEGNIQIFAGYAMKIPRNGPKLCLLKNSLSSFPMLSTF
ncbi:MAG: hypothetical protein ACOH5I_03135 [Oligoflexus sp.]